MTIREAVEFACNELAQTSFEEAEFEARQLAAFCLGKRRLYAFETAEEMPEEALTALKSCLERRKKHEPLQYIIGEWEFMGLPFIVNESVLIPRADTETLAEAAEEIVAARKKSGAPAKTLLDVCTGSGCIGISLAKRTGISALLCDISEQALSVAERNIKLNGVCGLCECRQGDLFEAALPTVNARGSGFDIITINPPYIRTEVMRTLQPEVTHEPELALDGGADGLEIYRRIKSDYRRFLNPGGTLLLEIGFDQGKTVSELFDGDGAVSVLTDICGNERVVVVKRA